MNLTVLVYLFIRLYFVGLVAFVVLVRRIRNFVAYEFVGSSVTVVTGVVVVYCYTGGMKSVIATEAIQYSIFAIAIPLLLWIAVSKSGVNLQEADAKAWSAMRSTLAGMTPVQIVGLLLSFFLGEAL